MPKLPNVTDAELTACHIAADQFLSEMQDLIDRIQKGYVERIENPVATAKAFALFAREASALSVQILIRNELQKARDELNALRGPTTAKANANVSR